MLKYLNQKEKIGYAFLLIIFAISVYTSQTNLDFFENNIAQEDGFSEYTTAILLFVISIITCVRLIQLFKHKSLTWKLGMLFFALLFFFGAGEEISWGQRIFGIETPEYFKQNNAQYETNLHNLVIGDVRINKLVFSKIFTIVLALYLLLTPVLYAKVTSIKKLIDNFAIPIVQWNHSIAFIVSSLIILIIPSAERWEVYELAFSVIFLLIIFNPVNNHIYQKDLDDSTN